MSMNKPLLTLQEAAGAVWHTSAGEDRLDHYGDAQRDYQTLVTGIGLHDRSARGLIEVSGPDRADWLHNLTTNDVRALLVGMGCRTLFCNAQGRILFDANVLALPESLWLDLDRRMTARAMAHLEKYHLAEQVTLSDRGNDFHRLALTGTGRHELLPQGAPHWEPVLTRSAPAGTEVCGMSHPFCGLPGVELFVPPDQAASIWSALQADGAEPVGLLAVDARRTEAGLAWSGPDIEGALPAETNLSGQAVSFSKGCYLGQEVVERMRARGVAARRFVGVRTESGASLHAPATLDAEGTAVGKLTSACHSPALGTAIGLGYVRAALAVPGTPLTARWEDGQALVEVHDLPFVES